MSASFRVSTPSARARRERRQAHALGRPAACRAQPKVSAATFQTKAANHWVETLLQAYAAWGRTHAQTRVGRHVDSSLRWLARRLHRTSIGATQGSTRHRYQSAWALPGKSSTKRASAQEPAGARALVSPAVNTRRASIEATPEPTGRTVRIYSSPSRVIWVGRIDEICSLIERRIAEEQACAGATAVDHPFAPGVALGKTVR